MPDTTPISSVGVIGLGNMGAPLCERWIGAGYRVRGFDLSATARERLRSAGGLDVDDAAAAAAADVLVLVLPDSRAVNDVVAGLERDGALAPGLTVIDMGSSEPAETRRHAERLAGQGVRLVDAPVSGGVRGAEEGSLTIMAGGRDEDVACVRALLDVVGTVHHVGPPGAGHAIKALNNLVSAGHLWLTSEAVLVAQAVGIRPEDAIAVFNQSSARSGSSEVKWPRFVLTGSYDSGFAARLMLKDTRIAAEVARHVGAPSQLADIIVELWSAAVDALPPAADHTEIVRWLRAGGAKGGPA